jgi:hypothetical protein
MAEMGLVMDARCDEALDLLERKELPSGGWAAEGRFYKVSKSMEMATRFGSISAVDWGGSGVWRMNEWITSDALHVLRAARRI